MVEAVKKSGGKVVALQGDMAVEADIERVFDEAARSLGPVTHFVHCSGIIGPYSRLDEADTQMMREVFEIDTSARCFACAPAPAACRPSTAARVAPW